MRARLDLRLYAVLDPERCHGRDLGELAAAAARGGATLVQYRDKRAEAGRLVVQARVIAAALVPFGVPLLVNDRADVAAVSGAQGVHLGQQDLAPDDARRLLGPAAIIGATVHRADEADAVQAGVVDYAGLGPVYPTSSKDPGDPPLGPDGLGRLIGRLRATRPGFPVVAIAGIDAGNAAAVIAAGADGVAVISSLFMAEDVEAAARRLRHAVDEAFAARGPS